MEDVLYLFVKLCMRKFINGFLIYLSNYLLINNLTNVIKKRYTRNKSFKQLETHVLFLC
jgi:hypothetical protein